LARRWCRRRRRVGIGGPGARGTPSRRSARQRIRPQGGRRRSVVGLGARLCRAAGRLIGLTNLAGACWLAGSGLAGACWLAGRTGPGGIGRVGGALRVEAPGGVLGSLVPTQVLVRIGVLVLSHGISSVRQ